MLTFVHLRDAGAALRFYRVELAYNLFGEYSVLREWGGRRGRGQRVSWFANLRDAVRAAERWNRRAQRRGYRVT